MAQSTGTTSRKRTWTPEVFHFTHHARQRMDGRSISLEAVQAVLRYGRRAYSRGALIFAIGRKEVRHYRTLGIDLRKFQNIHLICTPDGIIMTTYRSADFRPLRRHA